MKENELTIEIPDGKIVDWKESEKQNKIVLKDKQKPNYRDIMTNFFHGKECYYPSCSDIKFFIADKNNPCLALYSDTTTTNYHQIECLTAKNMLANIAFYLNDGWKPSDGETIYILNKDYIKNSINIDYWLYTKCNCSDGEVIFKSKELAQQAIDILGEETIKLALEPLGI